MSVDNNNIWNDLITPREEIGKPLNLRGKRLVVEYEKSTQYWVFIPTITWHTEIKEVEILFLCFGLWFKTEKY